MQRRNSFLYFWGFLYGSMSLLWHYRKPLFMVWFFGTLAIWALWIPFEAAATIKPMSLLRWLGTTAFLIIVGNFLLSVIFALRTRNKKS